jgi:hypothetical protein
MKTLKTSSNRRIVIALLAATIVTLGMAIPIVVKPVYAQLDDISREQIVGEIPDSDAIRENVEELTSQSVPRLPELGISVPLPPPSISHPIPDLPGSNIPR